MSRQFWRFTVILQRLNGIGILLVAAILGVFGTVGLIAPEADSPRSAAVLVLIAAVAIAWAGVWICRKQSYRPDLGDRNPMLGASEGYDERYREEWKHLRRTWWTGDPLADDDPRA